MKNMSYVPKDPIYLTGQAGRKTNPQASKYIKLEKNTGSNKEKEKNRRETKKSKKSSDKVKSKENNAIVKRKKVSFRVLLATLAASMGLGAFFGGKVGYKIGKNDGQKETIAQIERKRDLNNINKDNMPKQVREFMEQSESKLPLFNSVLSGEKPYKELTDLEVNEIAGAILTLLKTDAYANGTDEDFDPYSLMAKQYENLPSYYTISDKDHPERKQVKVEGEDYSTFDKFATIIKEATTEDTALRKKQELIKLLVIDAYEHLLREYGVNEKGQDYEFDENGVLVPYLSKNDEIQTFRVSIARKASKEYKGDHTREDIYEAAIENSRKKTHGHNSEDDRVL